MSVLQSKRLTRILWIAFGLVMLCFLVPYAVGLFLPDRYEVTLSLWFEAEPEELWAQVEDVERNPLSGDELRSIRDLPDESRQPAWIEVLYRSSLLVHTEEARAPEFLHREASDAVRRTERSWRILLEESEGGTLVTVRQDLRLTGKDWSTPYLRVVMEYCGGKGFAPRRYLEGVAGSSGVSTGSIMVEEP